MRRAFVSRFRSTRRYAIFAEDATTVHIGFLERNELYGYGVEPQAAGPTRARGTTPVKAVSAIHVQSPSDDQFAPYRKLIEELRELAAAEETKTRRARRSDERTAGFLTPFTTERRPVPSSDRLKRGRYTKAAGRRTGGGANGSLLQFWVGRRDFDD